MNNRVRLSLELATHPLRNRRLFFVCVFLLVVMIAGMTLVSANLYFDYRTKADETYLQIEEIERNRGRMQVEEKRIEDRVKVESAVSLSKIDLINSVIYQKSFSWIAFLSDLESALPARCYIVSLAPSPRGELGMEVMIRVAYPVLQDLLTLYTQLVKLGFKDVLIRGEEAPNNGQLLAEVSFIYERHI